MIFQSGVRMPAFQFVKMLSIHIQFLSTNFVHIRCICINLVMWIRDKTRHLHFDVYDINQIGSRIKTFLRMYLRYPSHLSAIRTILLQSVFPSVNKSSTENHQLKKSREIRQAERCVVNTLTDGWYGFYASFPVRFKWKWLANCFNDWQTSGIALQWVSLNHTDY